jgi:hypothetical protein
MISSKLARLNTIMGLALLIIAGIVLVSDAQASTRYSSTRQPHAGNPVEKGLGGGVPITPTAVITLTPGVVVSLTYTNFQGLTTSLDFPADVVTQTVTVGIFDREQGLWHDGFIFTGHTIQMLPLTVNGRKAFPHAPITITTHYDDSNMPSGTEANLRLYFFPGDTWQDAALTCNPPSSYSHDVTNNYISVAVCIDPIFVLLTTYRAYLPILFK